MGVMVSMSKGGGRKSCKFFGDGMFTTAEIVYMAVVYSGRRTIGWPRPGREHISTFVWTR